MKNGLRIILGLLFLASVGLIGCEGGVGPTPPIAGPSANAPEPSSLFTTPLPLHASTGGEASGTANMDAKGGLVITAVPALIYTLNSGKTAESVITVQKGIFPANAQVTVWGEVPSSTKTTVHKEVEEIETGKMSASVMGMGSFGNQVVAGMNNNQVVLSSPPSIIGSDLDTSKPDLQMNANSEGGLTFTLLAGNSTGTFTIKVAYPAGNILLTTFVIISQ